MVVRYHPGQFDNEDCSANTSIVLDAYICSLVKSRKANGHHVVVIMPIGLIESTCDE